MISEEKQQITLQNDRLLEKMTSSLHKKHSQSFHFFQARIINQILHSSHHSLPYIELNDVRAYTDTTEFLRRVYFYRTQTGRSEIEHRIKLCSEFYAKAIPLAYQYPMMVITNTESLFMKRNRRMKKIQAGEGSSDETEKKDQDYVDFYEPQSFDFLEDLDHSSIEGDNQSSVDLQSYDSDVHECFESASNEQQFPPVKLNLKNINEQSIKHLLFDGSPLQQEKQQLNLSTTHSSQKAVLEGSNKDHSTTVVPIQAKDSFKSSVRRGNLSKYLNIIQDMRKLGVNSLEKSVGEENINQIRATIDSEKTVLESNRKKIRQKAQQLLRRVKNQTDGNNV